MALGALAGTAWPQAAGDDEAGARGRKQLAELVEKCFAAEDTPQAAELNATELAFGLPLVAVESQGRRVLATSGAEEARRVAQAIGAARTLFVELSGIPARLPYGLSAYLLGSNGAKDQFLSRHPKLGPEARAVPPEAALPADLESLIAGSSTCPRPTWTASAGCTAAILCPTAI